MRKFLLWSVTCVAVGSASACGGDDDGSKGGNGNANCVPQAAECYVAGPKGPGAECLAKADNAGQATWQGRLLPIRPSSPNPAGRVAAEPSER